VMFNGGPLAFTAVTAPGAMLHANDHTIDLALPASETPLEVTIGFHYKHHADFDGVSAAGFTLVWPYHCGNLFPCHSRPDDGLTISLELTGVPAGKMAVFPPVLTEAPSYQIAWSIDAYTELPLGLTTAGTSVSMWYRPTEMAAATTGGTHLRAVFDWLEKNIGPYRFGTKVGTVSVRWGAGALGGMEHHPMWHISSSALADHETNAHEAAHGWYGDGIRVACWEDFVLSEGTTTYLAGRALDVVAPTVGASVWASYATELNGISATAKVWPQSCNAIDILDDDLFTNAPYIRGAFFYRAVALKLGAGETGAAMLDQALKAFYTAHAGKAAHMSDMLDTIKTVTGYDPTACADMWLKSTTKPAANTPCP
jgi:aminopeptidase N